MTRWLERYCACAALLALSFNMSVHARAQTPVAAPESMRGHAPSGALQSPPLRVEVIDGKRFRDIETQITYRLYGIDTCEPNQIARLGRQSWPCGTMAKAWLVTATLNKWVACNVLRQNEGEHLARCASADHADIAGDMIRDGVAVTSGPAERDPGIWAYAAAETEARKAYRGLWSSSFLMPWDYRDATRQRPATTPVIGTNP